MSRPSPLGHLTDASSRVLRLVLDAMGIEPADMTAITAGLPAPAGEAGWCNLIVAATPCSPPLFEHVAKRVALLERRDVLLVRTGLHPEVFDPVTAEVVLYQAGEAIALDGMIFFRSADEQLWLVPPPGERGAVLLSAAGLELRLAVPYADADERSDGLARAAAEIKRRVLRRGAR